MWSTDRLWRPKMNSSVHKADPEAAAVSWRESVQPRVLSAGSLDNILLPGGAGGSRMLAENARRCSKSVIAVVMTAPVWVRLKPDVSGRPQKALIESWSVNGLLSCFVPTVIGGVVCTLVQWCVNPRGVRNLEIVNASRQNIWWSPRLVDYWGFHFSTVFERVLPRSSGQIGQILNTFAGVNKSWHTNHCLSVDRCLLRRLKSHVIIFFIKPPPRVCCWRFSSYWPASCHQRRRCVIISWWNGIGRILFQSDPERISTQSAF